MIIMIMIMITVMATAMDTAAMGTGMDITIITTRRPTWAAPSPSAWR